MRLLHMQLICSIGVMASRMPGDAATEDRVHMVVCWNSVAQELCRELKRLDTPQNASTHLVVSSVVVDVDAIAVS